MAKKTCLALLGNIPAHQKEIIGLTILQMQMFVDNLTIIDFYKDNKLNKILNGESDVIKAEQWEYNGWSEIYNNYKDILKEFDNVIIFKAPTMRGYKNISDIEMLKDIKSGVKKDDKYKMQHDMMRRNIERILFVVAARDKNVIHLCIDNQEVNFSEVWKFRDYKRLCKVQSIKNKSEIIGPIFEYAMVQTYIQEIPKAQDLYYIASMDNKEREYLRDYIGEINRRFGKRERGGYSRIKSTGKRTNPTTGKCELFNDKELKDNRVSQSTYYYNLMLSKYTLVNAPYDRSVFNIVRFIEAIICNCVPIILPDCNMQNLKLIYPDFYDIIFKRYLTEDLEHIHRRIRNYDKDKIVLSDIRRTKSYHRMTDEKYIKSFYDNLLK